MLDFLHPYVSFIVDFLHAVDGFMEQNGAEFNGYVLIVMCGVIGYAKFVQKAQKAKGLGQKLQGKLELFAAINLLMPPVQQTFVGCSLVFFCLGMQIFVKFKETKAELLMTAFARQIFTETWHTSSEATALLPKHVVAYGPTNAMWAIVSAGMVFGLIKNMLAPPGEGAERIASRLAAEMEARKEKKDK